MDNDAHSIEQLAIQRSVAYGLFATLFEYPTEDLHGELSQGDVLLRLRDALMPLDNKLADAAMWSPTIAAVTLIDLQNEYTRLFDVGLTGRPPCPLMGSSYAGTAKMKSMEEALRFYNHFGLILNQQQKTMPDQLGTELEFLHFLAYQQAVLIQQGEPHDAYRRAERDFLTRELLFWIPKMNKEMVKISDAVVYKPMANLLEVSLRTIAEHSCLKGSPGG